MFNATAADTASIRYLLSWVQGPAVSYSESHLPNYGPSNRQLLSDTKQETGIREVRPIPANWLPVVRRRIQKSVAPLGRKVDDDQQWLRQDIADAAETLFNATSDVLPSEPYIYSSLEGYLVAEFCAAHGTMTNIISTSTIVVFAVMDGKLIERRLGFDRSEIASLRQELQRITTMLRAGSNGAQVGPKD